jgi:hypothetical protein
MTPRKRIGAAAAVAAAATLGLSGVAGANAGHRSYQKTYPVASRLCAEIARGEGPKRLLRHAGASVLADCSTLQASFTAATTTVLAAEASVVHSRAAVNATTKAACAGKLANRPSCRKTRAKADQALQALEHQRVLAAHAYYRAVEAARRTFWTAIRALPGGRLLREDAPIPVQSS